MLKRVFEYFRFEIGNFRSGKAFIFLVCLAFASFLWFLNALEKHYTDHITVPISYVNLPSGKGLVGKLPDKFELTVDAYGYTLLQHKLRLAFSQTTIDVNELTNKNLESRYLSRYIISTNDHKDEFAKQISNEIQIISIHPDTISFTVTNLREKLVKICPVLNLNLDREFVLRRAPQVEPESVLITGPESIIDTLECIYTNPINIKKIAHQTVNEATLNLKPELTSKILSAKVLIEVEQSTEAKFDVPVKILHEPDTLLVKTFPSKVRVSCRVGLSNYNKVTSSGFMAIVDFSERLITDSKLNVKLEQVPDFVISADFFPKEVDYIIEKK